MDKSGQAWAAAGIILAAAPFWSSVALAKSGTTVGAPPLAQSEAEEDANGEEEDGTQDAQAGEVVLQHPNPAGRAAPYHNHGGLDDGVRAAEGGLLSHSWDRAWHGRISLSSGIVIGRRWLLESRRWRASRWDSAIILLLTIFIRPRNSVIGWGLVLQKGFIIHIRHAVHALRFFFITVISAACTLTLRS